MKIVIATDSFKGSLSSMEAGTAIAEGIHRAIPGAQTVIRPLADGGEGTVEALVCGMNGTLTQVTVTGPLGDPVTCGYGILADRRTAILEMSAAAGITLVPENKRNPLYTTTYGVGELIRDAIAKGCRHFIVGIGGSATNDGGAGMLQALGFDLLDHTGNPITPGARGLEHLAVIRTDHVLPELAACDFRIACDVTNTLCGENGCSAVYGPQKGADPAMIKDMDSWLASYAALAREVSPAASPDTPGTGAAGGMGFAFLTFFPAVLESGIRIILDEIRLKEDIQDADLIVTGEGCLDGQTAMGKAPLGVSSLGKKHHKPVIAFAGSVTKDARICNECGIDAFFPILRRITTLEDAMAPEHAASNLRDSAEQVFRFLNLFPV